jgi:hypothetical protein
MAIALALPRSIRDQIEVGCFADRSTIKGQSNDVKATATVERVTHCLPRKIATLLRGCDIRQRSSDQAPEQPTPQLHH